MQERLRAERKTESEEEGRVSLVNGGSGMLSRPLPASDAMQGFNHHQQLWSVCQSVCACVSWRFCALCLHVSFVGASRRSRCDCVTVLWVSLHEWTRRSEVVHCANDSTTTLHTSASRPELLFLCDDEFKKGE